MTGEDEAPETLRVIPSLGLGIHAFGDTKPLKNIAKAWMARTSFFAALRVLP
jgi:hypothetical protein